MAAKQSQPYQTQIHELLEKAARKVARVSPVAVYRGEGPSTHLMNQAGGARRGRNEASWLLSMTGLIVAKGLKRQDS